MKRLILVGLMSMSGVASAGGWTVAAVPTTIDVERGNGLMVWGAFGNPGGCVSSNQFYIRIDHPQYKQMYAAVLAAFAGKYKIQAYVHDCDSIGWYASPSVTFNIAESGSALTISN